MLADMDFWSPAGGAFRGVADLTAVDVAVLELGSGAVSFAEWLSCGLLLESVDQEKRRHIVVCGKEEGRARQAVYDAEKDGSRVTRSEDRATDLVTSGKYLCNCGIMCI